MADADNAKAFLLLLALLIGGVLITFNLLPASLGIGFGDISGVFNGFFIILARLTGVGLIVASIIGMIAIIKG